MQNGGQGRENFGSSNQYSIDGIERVASSSNVLGAAMDTGHILDLDLVKPLSGNDPPLISKTKRITVERSDSKKYINELICYCMTSSLLPSSFCSYFK